MAHTTSNGASTTEKGSKTLTLSSSCQNSVARLYITLRTGTRQARSELRCDTKRVTHQAKLESAVRSAQPRHGDTHTPSAIFIPPA